MSKKDFLYMITSSLWDNIKGSGLNCNKYIRINPNNSHTLISTNYHYMDNNGFYGGFLPIDIKLKFKTTKTQDKKSYNVELIDYNVKVSKKLTKDELINIFNLVECYFDISDFNYIENNSKATIKKLELIGITKDYQLEFYINHIDIDCILEEIKQRIQYTSLEY